MNSSPWPMLPRTRRSARRGAPAAVGLVLLAGCLSRESLYHDLGAAREQAYEKWQQERQRQQESETRLKGKLSLPDAIKLALVHNKSLQAVIQQRDVARGRVWESYAEAFPTLSVVGGYTRLDEVSSFDVGGRKVSLGYLDNYSVDLQVQQPLFRGGATRAALRAAKVFSCLTDEQVRAAVQGTIYAVARGYYDALLVQHLYAVAEEAVRSAAAHLADVKLKRAQGVAAEFDVLRAQVDLANFQAEMIQQRNRIHLARTGLLKAMGVSQESAMELSDQLAYDPLKPDLEEAVRTAYQNRADLYQAELALRLQEEALRSAQSRYWPLLDATFSQGWARPDPHITTKDEWGDVWRAGIIIQLPLFDGLRREGRILQEEAMLRQKKLELREAEERVLLEIRQAILSLQDARELVESQKQNVERATEGLRLAEVGYREGVHTEVEVTDARTALARAKGLYYQAIYAHALARLELQRASGVLGPRAEAGSAAGKAPRETTTPPGRWEESAGGANGRTSDRAAPATVSPEKEGAGE